MLGKEDGLKTKIQPNSRSFVRAETSFQEIPVAPIPDDLDAAVNRMGKGPLAEKRYRRIFPQISVTLVRSRGVYG